MFQGRGGTASFSRAHRAVSYPITDPSGWQDTADPGNLGYYTTLPRKDQTRAQNVLGVFGPRRMLFLMSNNSTFRTKARHRTGATLGLGRLRVIGPGGDLGDPRASALTLTEVGMRIAGSEYGRLRIQSVHKRRACNRSRRRRATRWRSQRSRHARLPPAKPVHHGCF